MMKIYGQRLFRAAMAALLAMTAAFAVPGPVQAASVIQVTTTKDEIVANGKCSLREAVIAANENKAVGGCRAGGTGTDTIVLPASSNLYEVSGTDYQGQYEDKARTGDLDILGSVIIKGAGPGKTRIFGSNRDRVFHVVKLKSQLVRFEDLEITGGDKENRGGGIYNQGSRVELDRVLINGNHAVIAGGGVSSDYADGYRPSLTITRSTIMRNTSNSFGGGIASDGNLIIEGSLITNNTAVEAGGGIDNNAQPGDIGRMTNSTVTNNDAPADSGGGVAVYGDMDIYSSTIYHNTGGGILVASGTLDLKNTVIADHPNNCSVSDGTQSAALMAPAVIHSSGNNLADDSTCRLSATGDQVVLQGFYLKSLADNGGPTQTLAIPDETSAAVNKGKNCPTVDQRGYGRYGTCDVGAFEFNGYMGWFYLPVIRR